MTLMVSGCGFSIATEGPVVGGDDEPGTEPDATVVARMCSTDDPSLRLCIDFDDVTNLAIDQFDHPVEAINLTPMQRATGEPAVEVGTTSHVHVAETPDLDIPDKLTVSMWIKFDIDGVPISTTSSRWLFDNNTQYFASLRFGSVIRCGSGAENADSLPVPIDGAWHHVACTYERDEIRVYVDGDVGGCESVNDRLLPTGGDDGFAIGGNVSGGPGGPKFTEQFVGGIDDMQVFARTLSATELCTAAGHTGCDTTLAVECQ